MDLRRRFKEYFNVNHLLRNKNLAICAALAKYGYSQFSLQVLEYSDPSNILKREQYYLDLIKPQYNILKTAGSFVGFKHTEETKNKLAVLFKGNKNSQNHPAAVSVEVLDLESGETSIFSSARKAAVALNISNSTVMYKLRGNPSKTYKNRYIFNYTEKPRHFSVYLSRSPNTCCVNSFIIPLGWAVLETRLPPPHPIGLVLICICFFELDNKVLFTEIKEIKNINGKYGVITGFP